MRSIIKCSCIFFLVSAACSRPSDQDADAPTVNALFGWADLIVDCSQSVEYHPLKFENSSAALKSWSTNGIVPISIYGQLNTDRMGKPYYWEILTEKPYKKLCVGSRGLDKLYGGASSNIWVCFYFLNEKPTKVSWYDKKLDILENRFLDRLRR